MPPKRGRKKVPPRAASSAATNNVEISDDEDFRRALEENRVIFDDEERRRVLNSSLDEDQQLQEALKRSLEEKDEFDEREEMVSGPSSLRERLTTTSGASQSASATEITNGEESDPEESEVSEESEASEDSDSYFSAEEDGRSLEEKDEFDEREEMVSGPSSLRERLTTTSGASQSASATEITNGEESDPEESEVSEESEASEDSDSYFSAEEDEAEERGGGGGGRPKRSRNLNSSLLTNSEKNERLRTIFQAGLEFQNSGEEMEACKAVATALFQHQQVGLAWMSNKENTGSDGLLGGILADEMGLGKTLTVIALILTNFWDQRPLLKPDLGFTRHQIVPDHGNKGKGKVGGRFQPKLGAKDLGIGSKIKNSQTKSVGGFFSKFKVADSSDSESEKENKKTFSFGNKSKGRGKNEDMSSEDEDDEFDCMSKNKNIFSASKFAFKKKENPVDEVEDEELDEDEAGLSQEEMMRSMIPTALEDSAGPFNSKLNVDGFGDDDSSDEDPEPRPRKRKNRLDSDEDEDVGKDPKSLRSLRKKIKPAESLNSDSDLPDPDLEDGASGSSEPRGEPSKKPGQNVIIPPRQPAVMRGRRRATLIVCPTSLISHWVEQLDTHLHRAVNIKVKVHHGSSKALTGADLETFDIVITSYGVLANEFGVETHSPLLRAKWLRVVLDEGHMIKNHHTKTAKAALNLDTLRRWIVTGTPIQNNLLEFWSMINWLQFGAYAGKSNLKHYKRDIIQLCKHGDPRGFQRLQLLIDAVCLRRTKTDKKPDGSALVDLPSKTIITRAVEMDEEESVIYRLFQAQAQRIVKGYNRRGELLRNYAHIFALMIRLRQLCCHRELIKEVDWNHVLGDLDNLKKQLQEEEKEGTEAGGAGADNEVEKRLMKQLRDMIRSGVTEDCSICLDDLKIPVITPCAHVFCRACIETVIQTLKPPTCPLCRAGLTKKGLLEAGQDDEGEDEVAKSTANDMEDIHVKIPSSKVNAVVREMLRIKRDCPEDKVVVVSQFTSFLSIVQTLITEEGFSYVRLDG